MMKMQGQENNRAGSCVESPTNELQHGTMVSSALAGHCWGSGNLHLLLEWPCIVPVSRFIPLNHQAHITLWKEVGDMLRYSWQMQHTGSTALAQDKAASCTSLVCLASPLSHCQSQHQLQLSAINLTLTCLGPASPPKEQGGISEFPKT